MGQVIGFLFSCFTLVEVWDIVNGRRAAKRGRASDEEIAKLIAECRSVFPTGDYQHRQAWHDIQLAEMRERHGPLLQLSWEHDASNAYQAGWLPPE